MDSLIIESVTSETVFEEKSEEYLGISASSVESLPSPGPGERFEVRSSPRTTSKTSSRTNSRASENVTIISRSLKEFIGYLISGVGEVEAVLIRQEGKILCVYVVMNDFDAMARAKVYEKEEFIIDVFEQYEFDFHIRSRRGRPLHEYISDPGLELTFMR